LSSRGIDPILAKNSGCGFGYWKHWQLNDSGKYTYSKDKRVCFPIRNQAGDVVAMSARAIDNDYLDPKQVVRGYKSLGVFATPGALETDSLIVAEAPIDALSLAMAGFAAIATVGTSWPNWLINVARNKKLTLIAFDNDEPGDKASDKLLAELSNVGANAIRLAPSRKDWNEVLLADGLDTLKSQVNNSISSSYFPVTEITSSLICSSLSV
jgi:DNA primase